MKELKPCPFCGGQAQIESDEGSHIVFCDNKDCTFDLTMKIGYSDPNDAIKAWNTRPSPISEADITEMILEKSKNYTDMNHVMLIRGALWVGAKWALFRLAPIISDEDIKKQYPEYSITGKWLTHHENNREGAHWALSQQGQGWISVEDRLPEPVLCKNKYPNNPIFAGKTLYEIRVLVINNDGEVDVRHELGTSPLKTRECFLNSSKDDPHGFSDWLPMTVLPTPINKKV